MESSFMNVNFSYKGVTSTLFPGLHLCLQFLKNNQLKIILTLKGHISGCRILLPLKPKVQKRGPGWLYHCGGNWHKDASRAGKLGQMTQAVSEKKCVSLGAHQSCVLFEEEKGGSNIFLS